MNSIPANGPSISKILEKISETTNATGNDELIELVISYLKRYKQDYTRFDAIRWISNMMQTKPFLLQNESEKFIEENKAFQLKSQKEIQHPGLLNYLDKHFISIDLARIYLKELKVRRTDIEKDFYTLGFKNDNGGFEIRSPFIKGCISEKNISFIRGTQLNPKTVHIFKSFWDYLSFLSLENAKSLGVDTIVLNSISNLNHVFTCNRIFKYTKAYTWMDNYAVGEYATALLYDFFKTEMDSLSHIPMNRYYTPYIDVSKWYQDLNDDNNE